MPAIIISPLLLLVWLSLSGCSGGGGSAPPPNYQPPITDWTQFFGTASVNGGSFDFPPAPGNSQYVVHPQIAVALGQTITLAFQITGSGTWGITDTSDTLPPHVHLFLWQRGDNLTGQGAFETYREWCGRLDITNPGQYVLTCKIDPTQWTGVFGQTPSAAAFQQLLSNLYGVGYTFGGNIFAGHGVYSATGSFHFQLLSYSVQ